MKYLADEKVNTGRQPEIDMTKAVIIILMIVVHSFQGFLQNSGFLTNAIYNTGYINGAAAFMICMGIGMRYSRRKDPKDTALRGIALLTVGQLLNLLRTGFPGLIAFLATGELTFIPFILDTFQSDIMTFAGLAFLLMALLKKLKLRDGWILAIGAVMNCLTLLLFSTAEVTEEFLPRRFLNLFIKTGDSLFPLGSYFFFVTVGYMIGGIYPRIADKRRLANRVLLVCVPAAAIYLVIRMTVPVPLTPEFDPQSEPDLGLDAVSSCMNAFIIMAVLYHICRLTGGKVPAFMAHLSQNINRYYCVSDVLLGISLVVLLACGAVFQNQWAVLLISISVTAVCYAVIELNARYVHFTLNGLKGAARIIVYTAIWIVSLAMVLYGLSLIKGSRPVVSFFAG